MSVLIKGMEMPKTCEECALGDSLHCQVLPSVPALWAEYTNAIREKRLHSDCPLVSVPPHGRLWDMDAIARKIRRFGDYVEFTKDEIAGWFENGDFETIISEEDGK